MAHPMSPWRKRLAATFGVVTVAALAVLADACVGLGHHAEGARLERMRQSPQWHLGHFENPEPIVNDWQAMLHGLAAASPDTEPRVPLEVQPVDPAVFAEPPPSGLRVTWLGHSTTLIEIDGHRFLTDPVWSERVSPVTWLGPKRWYPPLLSLDALPPLDAVLISHDHYDHLDHRTIIAMAQSPKFANTRFVVPLGVGAHLEYWGVPAERIVEVDWWQRVPLGDLEIVSTPIRHASGRHVFDRDATLWSSYALVGPAHRAFFSGDTGLFSALQDIGDRLGPFDVTLLEIGQYHRAWPDWHMGPEQAVFAHRLLRGRVFVPVHWGLFNLAYHSWTEPIERSVVAAQAQHVVMVAPRPGERVEPTTVTESRVAQWWPTLPWQTAEEHRVTSGNVVLKGEFATGRP